MSLWKRAQNWQVSEANSMIVTGAPYHLVGKGLFDRWGGGPDRSGSKDGDHRHPEDGNT